MNRMFAWITLAAFIFAASSSLYEADAQIVRYPDSGGRKVRTLQTEGVFIETGIFDEECIEVISGLSLGDIVVTSWSPKLTDGVLLTDVTE